LRFTPASSHDYDAPAMPEASVLYSVTGVVVAGLLVWVGLVLKSAKEPWNRPAPTEQPATEHDTPEEKKLDPDETAPETPTALSESKTKAAEEMKAPAPEEDKPAADEQPAQKEEEKKAEA
jgi:hypothetical protein